MIYYLQLIYYFTVVKQLIFNYFKLHKEVKDVRKT